MPPTAPIDPATGRDQASHALLVEELERRIVEIEALDDSELGHFTRWDWVLCVAGAVVAPAVAMWWFAG
jgi:hypothetical protein